MEMLSNQGRTSIVFRVGEGHACKIPREMQQGLSGREAFAAEVDNAFTVEERLFKRL
jgi:hypothetical protein